MATASGLVAFDNSHLNVVQSHENISLETVTKPYSYQEIESNYSEYDQAGGHLLRRFYFRALVGVLGPLTVTGYFIAIWRIYLAPINPDNPIAFGPPGAKWIFYSWFVVGVIGLNLSLYSLKGVEASMLMEPSWNVGEGMNLMLHASNAWSGPGGWLKTVRWSWQTRDRGKYVKLPALLWFVLALPSIFVFVAYPLSGLTMEMTQGYLHGSHSDEGPKVIGYRYADFNERDIGGAFQGASVVWGNAFDARVPGHGIVYTPEGYDRSSNSYLNKLPSVFPTDVGVYKTFLTAQAEDPIEGNAWGLLFSYDCSIIETLEDSLILSRHNRSQADLPMSGYKSFSGMDDNPTIVLLNRTDSKSATWASNIEAVLEVGYEQWPANRNSTVAKRNAYTPSGTTCYFNEEKRSGEAYPGINDETIFEIVLWQDLWEKPYSDGTTPRYDFTIDHNITELHGAYKWVAKRAPNSTAAYRERPMTAIGVQCKASSNVGTATINGLKSTYSNFTVTDTPRNPSRCANRLQAESPYRLLSRTEWLSQLFTSIASPPPLATEKDVGKASSSPKVQPAYLQAAQLRQSMLRAYAAYATQLMYNGGQGITYRTGADNTFRNPNITEFVSATVITRGVVPAAIPVVLFVAWALVSSVLGGVYGFRRRWTAVVDGYAMFRLGVDLPEDLKRRVACHSNTLEVENCVGLNDVPGLVGDVKPEMWIGRIGLVGNSAAMKHKRYE